MASNSDSGIPKTKTSSPQGPLAPAVSTTARGTRSGQLDRTLRELESAFHDWDALTSEPGAGTEPSRTDKPEGKAPTGNDQADKELRKKTKLLLLQLREQLSELND